MAWNRQVELSVGESGQGLLISDLHIDFDITRSITFADNTAEFTVYNANSDTRNKVLQEGNNIIFKAGYEDEGLGTLFIGNITESNSDQDGPEWVTNIQASAIRSSKQPLENTTFSLSFKSGTLLNTIMSEIGAAMGLVVLGLENASIVLPNGWVYTGTAKGALDYCNKILKAFGSALYIDNNEIIIYVEGGTSIFSGVILSYTSGLKNVKEIKENTDAKKRKEKRILFNSLIIPKLQPNGLIKIIDTPSNDGSYLIEKLHFTGSNYAEEYNCEGEAIA